MKKNLVSKETIIFKFKSEGKVSFQRKLATTGHTRKFIPSTGHHSKHRVCMYEHSQLLD